MLQDKLQPFLDRYDEISQLLSAPDIASDIKRMTALSKEQSGLEAIREKAIEYIQTVEAIEENTAKELKERAEEYLKAEKEDIGKKLKELGVEDVLINFKGLTPGMLVTLGEKKIKTLKDFADLSTDELIGGYDEKQGKRFKIEGFLEEFALAKNEADDLIMNARNIVFK